MSNYSSPFSSNPSSDEIVYILENGLQICNQSLSVSTVKRKLVEFSNFFNSVGRLSVLTNNISDSEEFIFLLLTLKKNIKHALSELGRSRNKTRDNFVCGKCNEDIPVDSDHFWSCLQNHEHFEQLYCEFLKGNNLQNMLEINRSVDCRSVESICENTDCSSVYQDNEPLKGNFDVDIDIPNSPEHQNFQEEVHMNNFKFNFELHYDEVIETKLYPDTYMKAVRKIDKIKEYTIQRASQSRAVCLLCSCELMSRLRVSKICVMDHAIGQRHLKCSLNSENLNALRKYHETWLKLDFNYQTHQVYFRPELTEDLKCILCNTYVRAPLIEAHIQKDGHKKKVLELFSQKSNVFYLIDLQIHVYGLEALPTEIKKKEATDLKGTPVLNGKPTTVRIKKGKSDSDSSPSKAKDQEEQKHNIIKSVENITSKNILDLIPNRFKDHLKFFTDRGNRIDCIECNVQLAKDVEIIKKHIMQSHHIKQSKIAPKKYNYYCEICNLRILDENLWHKHFTEGPNTHANMAESRKSRATEYECTICFTVIFGDELSLIRHLSVFSRKDKKVKETKLPAGLKKLFSSKQLIETECEILTHEANDALIYNNLTKKCCAKLEYFLQSAYEKCKAYPFGSRISGLGNQYSDLDVFIDIGDMYTGSKNQDALTQVQIVRKVAAILTRYKDEFENVLQIPTARTPIVKLYHRKTHIECDLSFRHGLSVENTRFLRFCLDIQPITQPFILMLKKWSRHNNLCEHITTYALAIMAIFYLQINNYLLSVKKIQELNPSESLVINGWETVNYTVPLEQMKNHVLAYPHSIIRLLKDFFEYFAKFSYTTDVICPLLGYTIKKELFNGQGKHLPPEMRAYRQQLRSEEREEFRAMSSFCIQDPFDLSHNLTKACQLGTTNKLKILCDLSFKQLNLLK